MNSFKDKFINRFTEMLIDSGLAFKFQLKGCSDSEIKKLEVDFKISLPAVYKDFLKVMGHKAGKFYEGTDMFYDQLFYLREGFEELLREDSSSFSLPDNAFVFLSHQGYIYNFFYTEEDKFDPPVYGYKEGDLTPMKVSESFSFHLLDILTSVRDKN